MCRLRRAAIVVWVCSALSACASGDRELPWDTSQMTREIAQDLQRFERFEAEFRQVEVLAMRMVESQRQQPPPLTPISRRDYHAVVWARVESQPGVAAWILVEASRGEDDPWRRVIINRDLRAPLTHPRPGKGPDGTWHGFARYATPPSTEDVCAFARVSFLGTTGRSDTHFVIGQLRRQAWRRATGADPVCRMED
jgi:hypothetical protein